MAGTWIWPRWPGCAHTELKVGADISLDSDSPEWSWLDWWRHRQSGQGKHGEVQGVNGRLERFSDTVWGSKEDLLEKRTPNQQPIGRLGTR